MFSCSSGPLLSFPFCEQILVENGTKAGHCLLMEARDLVLKVRFFPFFPLLRTYLSPITGIPLKTEETLSYNGKGDSGQQAYEVIMLQGNGWQTRACGSNPACHLCSYEPGLFECLLCMGAFTLQTVEMNSWDRNRFCLFSGPLNKVCHSLIQGIAEPRTLFLQDYMSQCMIINSVVLEWDLFESGGC